MRTLRATVRSGGLSRGAAEVALGGPALARGASRPALAERLGVSVAGGAAVALLAYALLQLAGACGMLASPPDAIPFFWRLKIAAATSAAAVPGLWRLGGVDPGARTRILQALLLGGCGAIGVCAVFAP